MNSRGLQATVDARPAAAPRSPLNAILQARISEAEHRILGRLAHRHGVTLSEAVRAGAWNYLLTRSHIETTASGRGRR